MVVESQHLGHVGFVFLQILEQPFIREIEGMRVLPVLADHPLNTLDNRFVMDLDGQFTTAVKTARGKIDRADDHMLAVGQHQLGVQLEALEAVHLGAEVLQNAQSLDTLDQLALLEEVGRSGKYMQLYPATRRAHQTLDDHLVLVAFILQEQRFLGGIDEASDPVAAVDVAPHEMRVLTRIELVAVPVGVETLDDFIHLMPMRSDDSEVPGLREIPGLPVERLDESRLAVDDQRFLVGDVEGGIAVLHLDASALERLAGRLVLGLAATPGRVEHHPHLDPAVLRSEDRRQQGRIREEKDLDAQRLLRRGYGVDQGLTGVVRQNNE